MSPSSPARLSSCAQAVIRWSAASTSSGGSSRPISAALPESSAHRSTRASLTAALAPLPRLLRGDLHHRAGDRGAQPARGQPGGPVQHLLLGGAGLGVVEQGGGAGDDLGLVPGDGPVAQRRGGAGQLHRQVPGQVEQVPGRRAGLGQHVRHLIGGELSYRSGIRRPRGQPGAGLRRTSSAKTASLRAATCASTRSHAPSTPTSSASDTPGSSRPLPPRRQPTSQPGRQAGQHVQRHPGPERRRPARRLAGEDPRGAGLPGPRRPAIPAHTLASAAANSRISASSPAVSGSKSAGSSSASGGSSASLIGSGRDQAGPSSHSGSAGTGSGGMYHHPFGILSTLE